MRSGENQDVNMSLGSTKLFSFPILCFCLQGASSVYLRAPVLFQMYYV